MLKIDNIKIRFSRSGTEQKVGFGFNFFWNKLQNKVAIGIYLWDVLHENNI